ncbi:MAG TPA: hypothetical protein DCL06_08795 [Corynebacterium variabile]|uniref:Uncharacterized protein n=1 Tax=Corynebacterium variabile TaxID=1727 RepID=A0A3B9QVG0_9CORY|nr:hypothetical protein [Corynebacterium variabile]
MASATGAVSPCSFLSRSSVLKYAGAEDRRTGADTCPADGCGVVLRPDRFAARDFFALPAAFFFFFQDLLLMAVQSIGCSTARCEPPACGTLYACLCGHMLPVFSAAIRAQPARSR